MYEIAGIGIGPVNSSMAAKLEDVPEIRSVLLNRSVSSSGIRAC